MKSIKISIEKPTPRQRFIIVTANWLLQLAIILFKDNPQKKEEEIKWIIKEARKAL